MIGSTVGDWLFIIPAYALLWNFSGWFGQEIAKHVRTR